MKKIFLVITIFPLLVCAQKTSNSFKIRGTIKKPSQETEWIHFLYRNNGTQVHDSVLVKKGKFSFSGELAEPTMITIYPAFRQVDGKMPALNYRRDYGLVFADKGKIKVTFNDSLSNSTIKGSAAQAEYDKVNALTKSLTEERTKLIQDWISADKTGEAEKKKEISDRIDAIDIAVREKKGDYLRTNPGSNIAVYLLNSYAGWDIKPEEVEPLFDLLPETSRNYPTAQALKAKIEIAKKTGIGRTAMDFTQNDTLDKPVSLSSFRGTYVLIDFWASWCGPCRVENPNLVKAYEKFHPKGLNILSVSLDRENQKDRWLKAIHDDNLQWTHVSDLQYWKNAVAVMYGINAIPQNLLIDPQGKIIAKNLRGEELESKLEDLIDYKKMY